MAPVRSNWLFREELAHPQIGRMNGSLMFRLINKFYDPSATAITKNHGISGSAVASVDENMTDTLLDRLTHNCNIRETEG